MIRSMRFYAGRVVVWPLVVLVALVLLAALVSRTQTPKEETLDFRPIRKDKILFAFGQRYLQHEIDNGYELYEERFRGKSDAQIIRENTHYIRVDLNQDGVPEIFLQLGLGAFCGTAGCETILLQRRNGVWQEVSNLFTPSLSCSTNGTVHTAVSNIAEAISRKTMSRASSCVGTAIIPGRKSAT